MCRSNFRIKLDLCKFYNDVRRFCWIFVDGIKMLQISHMMEHITNLFNIKEPFHLLLNETEYLPPNEDIRVLKESETISVCPGSGLEIGSEVSAGLMTESQDNFAKIEIINNSVQHKESQTNLLLEPLNSILVQDNLSNEVMNRPQSDTLDTSTICDRTEDELSSIIDSKTIDMNVMEDISIEDSVPCRKRKRLRHRKKKPQDVKQSVTEEENKSKKPKIINSYIISSSKHIRFDNVDTEEVVVKEVIHGDTMNGCTNNASPSHELANLLSLGQNSTPITFSNTKLKEEIKIEHTSDEENRLNTTITNTNINVALSKKLEEGIELSSKDLKACPVMTTEPQVKDFIAFKMLKIGLDYTPQISEFIVAEVISYCSKTMIYTFKVVQGLSEVQVPVGKFTVVQDEEEHVVNDTITVNSAQIIEPRLVSTSDQDKVVTYNHNHTN
ncbi:uncharacterized protein LOC122398242 [Colletes gigas]|uniref:uncharacterized protein LOC122398242 n=1 Tax=Colletes gigas TaxID=935657 RepID=UPI001C9A7757|nr:uncharacterized protein LOC122398242 [Colletes gigas]